jgi:hypothetical protein
VSGLFGGLGDVRLILDTSAMLGYAIADHPVCQLVPEPSGMADLHADYARFYEREDLAAAMVLAVHLGCVLGPTRRTATRSVDRCSTS